MIRLRAKAPSNSHSLPLPLPIILSRTRSDAPPSGTPHILPIPLPNSSLSLLLPSTNHGADRPKVCLQPTKVLCFAFGPRYEVEESSSVLATRPTRGFKAAYGFIDTLYREIRRDSEREVGYGITDTWGTYEIYVRLGEAQDERSLMSGRLNLLQRDRRAHAHTALLMKREARLSCGSTTVRDYSLVSSRSHSAGISCGDTKTDEYTADISDSTAGTLQLKAMIDQGVTDALAACDADRNTNGDDIHNSGIVVRRTERVARECTYPDFMKWEPLNFKGTEGFVKLIQWSGIMDKYVSFQATNQSENQIKFFRLYPSLQVKSLLAMNVEPRDNLDRDCSKLEKQPMWVTKVGNGKAPAKKLCTAFSSQIDITPTTLDHYYDVELADVRIIRNRKSPTVELFDVDSGWIFIVTVNTKEYHSDVLENITRIMHRTLLQVVFLMMNNNCIL
ncbi:hypothetical protein Tco_0387195 [Tanacetum coccineum]